MNYAQKLWCLDEQIYVHGTYDSAHANNLAINIKRCDPTKRSTCKSDKEIDEWMFGKYLFIVENTYRVNVKAYTREERITQ